jgi:ComF family protein
MAMGYAKSIKNILFPEEHICSFCRENMAKPLSYICPSCMELVEVLNREVNLNLPHVEKVYYSVLYNRFIREKVHAFKFQGKTYLYKPFGEILIDTIEANGLKSKIEAIIFVPIHRRKKALRGYNQSELLAFYVAKALNMPLLKGHLIKTKWTFEQNKLGKIERKINLKDSFKAVNIEDFKGKEILLIDDIITTGATMEECAKVLVENGAKKVYGLALTSSIKL